MADYINGYLDGALFRSFCVPLRKTNREKFVSKPITV